MRATIPYIEEKFAIFNRIFFGGVLPVPRIKLSNSAHFLGALQHTTRRDVKTGKIMYANFVLKINTRIDLPEDVVEDTILHEMIHYFIFYQQIEDDAPHGSVFCSIMNRINEQGNRHLSITRKVASQEEAEQRIDKRPKMHVVCVVKLRDGRMGVKVLPRVVYKICKFNHDLPLAFAIENVDWYFTTEPYFNRFPVSTAMRLSVVESKDVAPYLATSVRCTVTANSVTIGSRLYGLS